MPSSSRGGRGKQAPYSTTHCRIPAPIKATVESLSAAYKILIDSNNMIGCENLLKSTNEAISDLGERELELIRLKTELRIAKSEIKRLEQEKQFAITKLSAVFNLHSREGVKMKEIVADAIPEIKTYPEFLASDKRKVRK